MKNVLKWVALSALFVLFACNQVEKPLENSLPSQPGVYGFITPPSCDDPATKATFSTDMKFAFETGDRINIWSDVGTLVLYTVTELTQGGGAKFDGGGFALTDGMTYYSAFPLISSVRDDFHAISFSYEGQMQTANDVSNHVAEYSYMCAEGPCTEGNVKFAYACLGRWIRFYLTLPKSMTVTELTITADSPVFALDGTVDVTTQTFTKGTMSDTMTLKFDDVAVEGTMLRAYMACSTYPACNVVVRVKDINGHVYTSPVIAQNSALNPNNYRTITTTLTEENPFTSWDLVTETSQLTTGTYVIAYPAADGYKLFSFEKTMANAQTAANLVADKHTFAEVVPMRGQLFQTCVNGNYETVEAPADPAVLNVPDAIESKVAIQATTLPGETANGTALLKSTQKNLGFESVVVALAADGAATITAAVNATDFKNICNYLRGHDLKFAFTDVMDYVAAECGISASAKSSALSAFDKICVAAKEELADHGYSLGDIDHTTRLMDVFADHYYYFADKSLGYSPEKAYGWLKPVGFYLSNDGFSARLPMPESEWFERLKTSFNYGEGGKAGFIAYWYSVDPEFPKILEVFNTASFFGRLAEKVMATTSDEMFAQLASINWTAVGQKYQTYCDDICANDALENIYIYKKAE